jgi:ABC-type transport system involved in cytochrome c biogenesis permease component
MKLAYGEACEVTEFEIELEIFRREEESAQQFFFAYLSVRAAALSDPNVLRTINLNPLFWITAHHSMLLAAFLALGRIFDQNFKHNIDRVMAIVARERRC